MLLGEDETSPKNRLVLICQNYQLVNGQAPPRIKSLGELGRQRCKNCGAWNNEETEARKVIADIQQAVTEDHEAAKSSEDEKLESEKNDDGELIKKEEEKDEDKQSEKEEETQSILEKTGTTQSESQPQRGVETRS